MENVQSLQQGSVRDDDELSSTLRIKNLAKYEGKQLLDELKKFGQVKFLFYAREGSYKGNFFVCVSVLVLIDLTLGDFLLLIRK